MDDSFARHDLQVHTKWSDGYRDIAGQVYLACSLGLEALAITDHLFPDLPLSDRSNRWRYREEIETAAIRYGCRVFSDTSQRFGEIRFTDDMIVRDGADTAGSQGTTRALASSAPLILRGVEATATDATGSFTIDEETASEFDWVLCDLSYLSIGTLAETPHEKSTYERNVLATYHAMCEASWIDVISHPFNTGNTDPPLLPDDYAFSAIDELAEHMAETKTVFDVMSVMPLWFLGADVDPVAITEAYTRLVARFADRGVLFQLSSDDHRSGLGNTGWSRRVLTNAGVGPELVVHPERAV